MFHSFVYSFCSELSLSRSDGIVLPSDFFTYVNDGEKIHEKVYMKNEIICNSNIKCIYLHFYLNICFSRSKMQLFE